MSQVSQLMVYPSGFFTENEFRFFESEMDRFFTGQNEKRPISIEDERLPTNWYSGGKYFGHLYLGAYNSFPLQRFLKFYGLYLGLIQVSRVSKFL